MRFLNYSGRLLKLLTTHSAFVAAGMVLAMLGLVFFEVIYRTLFGTSTLLAVEVSGYLLAALIALAQAYTFDKEGHVRISFIMDRWSPTLRLGVEVLWSVLGLAYVSLLTYFFFRYTMRSYSLGATAPTYWQTPLYIPQLFVVLGMGVFTLRFISQVCTASASLFGTLRKDSQRGGAIE